MILPPCCCGWFKCDTSLNTTFTQKSATKQLIETANTLFMLFFYCFFLDFSHDCIDSSEKRIWWKHKKKQIDQRRRMSSCTSLPFVRNGTKSIKHESNEETERTLSKICSSNTHICISFYTKQAPPNPHQFRLVSEDTQFTLADWLTGWLTHTHAIGKY